jgi:hypothetical protein
MGTKTPALCNFKSCDICCILKSSFHEFAFGDRFNTGRYVPGRRNKYILQMVLTGSRRFGGGIYSYRNPSLADMHATAATSTPYRVMIACYIAVQSDFEVSGLIPQITELNGLPGPRQGVCFRSECRCHRASIYHHVHCVIHVIHFPRRSTVTVKIVALIKFGNFVMTCNK